MMSSRPLLLAAACFAFIGVAAPALAQFRPGHIGGIIRSEDGTPVRGAVIVAENKEATPPRLNAVSDGKGRFGLLGLRSGVWSLLIKAPGFEPTVLAWPVRSTIRLGDPVEVTLVSIPGGSTTDVFDKVKAGTVVAELDRASDLLEGGQTAAALTIYRALLAKTPALTSLHLAMARAYRADRDVPHSLESYRRLLEIEPANTKARVELAVLLEESGDKTSATRELTRVVSDAPDSPAATTARTRLRALQP